MIDFNSAPGSKAKPSSSGWSHWGVQDWALDESHGHEASVSSIAPQKPFPIDTPVEKLPPYLQLLNAPQREAALTTDGPLIVLAGAGSGKTRMVTSRIAYLIDHQRVRPYQILAVTFTNKAAAEMRERVTQALQGTPGAGTYLGEPEIGTFHSVCVRILRREMDRLPFTKSFVIYDQSDQLSFVKRVMKKLDIDTKAFNPKSIQGMINQAKCDALDPDEIEVSRYSTIEKQFLKVYEQYQKDLFLSNAVDFGEILCLTYRLLRDHEDIRRKYQKRYQYIHVDEYQDTNRAQYLLLSVLASKEYGSHQNICVVGDEDQSIYGWRGADINNILDFEKEYSGATLVKLEQNYRSTKNIISAASEVIRHNLTRKNKSLWTENEKGELITRYQVPDERTEAELVVKEVKSQVTDGGKSLDDCVIFYRTHAQSRQFEDVLRREKIPYQVVGGLRFYDRKEIKDLFSYFKVVLNPADTVSLVRIINTPARSIGKTTVDKLVTLSHQQDDGSVWSVLERIVQGQPAELEAFAARTRNKLVAFYELISLLMEERQKMSLSDLYHSILDRTGYVLSLKKEGTPEALARIENLEELDTLILEFEEQVQQRFSEQDFEKLKPQLLEKFIEQMSLSTSEDRVVEDHSLRMMTLHSSKGLEFPTVFMVGMEEGLFPSVRSWEDESEEEIEEERRLCYVGMTRARQKLFMTHAVVRRIWGQVNYQDPARFFDEMPSELVDFTDLTQTRVDYSRPTSYSSSYEHDVDESSSDSEVTYDYDTGEVDWVGKKIFHPDYGEGRIIDVSGSGDQQKATIEFAGRVQKKFITKYLTRMLTDI